MTNITEEQNEAIVKEKEPTIELPVEQYIKLRTDQIELERFKAGDIIVLPNDLKASDYNEFVKYLIKQHKRLKSVNSKIPKLITK